MSGSQWEEVCFEDIMSIPLRNGLSKPKAIRGTGVKMVNMGEVFQFDRIFDEFEMDKVPTTEQEFTNTKLKQGDLLFARQSLVWDGAGKCTIVMQAKEDLVYESHIIRVRLNQTEANPMFYYYYFKSPVGKGRVMSIVEQVAAAGIRGSDLKRIKVPKPSFPEQKSIAKLLSCLDDKIELNNRINKNLEETAQAIFKSWFVDFEPFQDEEFEDSELGRIPKGWRVGTISDLGNVIGGSTPSKARADYYTKDGIAWITPKDLSINKNKFISKGKIDITNLGLKNSSAKIMPKDTVLFSSRAPIGYIAIAKNEVTTNQGFKSIAPKQNIGTAYVYYYLKNNIEVIKNRASGSTFKEVSGSVMKQIPALIPNDKVLKDFKNTCGLYFEKQMLLETQNQTLSELRDLLLPHLMSGEIQVPVEEVQ